MTRSIVLSVALLLGAAAGAPADNGSLLDFTAKALDGTEFDLSELAGQPVLLDFWGTWCAPCVHAFPKLKRLQADYGDRLAVVGLAFYSGDVSDLAKFVAEHELDYTVLAGFEETIDRFQVFAFPSYILISADGEVVFSLAGQTPDLYERVAGYLDDEADARHASSAGNASR